MQINPQDLKTLYSAVYGIGGSTTQRTPLIRHVTGEIFGLEIATGNKVPFQVSVSQIPSHVGSAFALASAVVNKVPVTDLYSGYTDRIAQILSFVNDADEVKDDIKRILKRHAAKAPRFLVVFNQLFAKNRTGVENAYIQFDKWLKILFQALDDAIVTLQIAMENRRLMDLLTQEGGDMTEYQVTGLAAADENEYALVEE
jgi:hypothetical protein